MEHPNSDSNNKIQKSWKDILMPAISLAIICVVVTLAVSGTHALTADRIAMQQELALSNAMGRLIVAERYEIVLEDEDGEPIIYAAITAEDLVEGHLFLTSSYGYSSYVLVLTAIKDGVVLGVDIVDASGETPGLGQNILHESFTNEFRDLTVAPLLVRDVPREHGEIQSLTGATISADAVVQAVAKAMEMYHEHISINLW